MVKSFVAPIIYKVPKLVQLRFRWGAWLDWTWTWSLRLRLRLGLKKSQPLIISITLHAIGTSYVMSSFRVTLGIIISRPIRHAYVA